MLLLIDPARPYLRWCTYDCMHRHFGEDAIELQTDWLNTFITRLRQKNQITAIGYLLYHGGELIRSPINELSTELLTTIERTIRFLPEYNELTYKLAQYGLVQMPKIPQLLFCDTAFYIDLPAEVSTYAVPYELREKGIRRFGRYGLCHQWVGDKIYANDHSLQKIISIYLGNWTNISAIDNGKPVETTIGFTPVEGIPSSTSCGDIDPTIIFQLHATGMSFADINQLLSRESGFTGFLGKPCNYLELIRNTTDPEMSTLHQIYHYDIIKAIGACISVLGGVDAFAFVSERLVDSIDFITEICRHLSFLGLKYQPIANQTNKILSFTAQDSPVKAFGLQYNQWEMMAEQTETILNKRGGILCP